MAFSLQFLHHLALSIDLGGTPMYDEIMGTVLPNGGKPDPAGFWNAVVTIAISRVDAK
jgi:hypothetical protein